MNNKYEQVVRLVCGDDWCGPDKSADDRDGALGVAIILAYLQGIPARLPDLASALDLPPYLLEMSYKRLQANGLFSPRSYIVGDPVLMGHAGSDESRLTAWCYIAGMASGYTGMGFTRDEYAALYGNKEEQKHESRA